ncbi:MAG: metallophosphoesterase [Bacteroidales bacterium]|nr:metallophosphoesterase [Bacteroidales bacterium]
MDRRQFLAVSAATLAGAGLSSAFSPLLAAVPHRKGEKYTMVILGDTHYDTEPASVYHSHYNEPVEWLNRVQRAEFARNGEMWRERCPRLLERASGLITPDTRMVLQMGDLIQGDCGSGDVHRKMLSDVLDAFKAKLGGLPFVTVVGNHDIRGTDAKKVYHEYMPLRMSQELGKSITKTTFSFTVGPDAFLVVDFNDPDDAELERLLRETEGARYTFVVVHGPVFPIDSANCRWFFHGKNTPEDTRARLHFRSEFARRHAIVLCGHTHCTELADWYGDGGRITQMTMNSVWAREELARFAPDASGAAQYGMLRGRLKAMPNGKPIQDETPLFDEYRPGLQRYLHDRSAGSYKLRVSPRAVVVEYYAGDAQECTCCFRLRGGRAR